MKEIQINLDELKEAGYFQLCVWPGTEMNDSSDPEEVAAFEKFIEENFSGRIKFVEQVTTLPDVEDGVPIPGTGGRHDLLFLVHADDISKFAVPRLSVGIEWWEDAIDHGVGKIYPAEFMQRFPRGW